MVRTEREREGDRQHGRRATCGHQPRAQRFISNSGAPHFENQRLMKRCANLEPFRAKSVESTRSEASQRQRETTKPTVFGIRQIGSLHLHADSESAWSQLPSNAPSPFAAPEPQIST